MTIALGRCGDCGRVNYPPREVCRNCLGERLDETPVSPRGVLLGTSILHASGRAYFRARLPWRIGSVLLDAGAVVICHLDPAVSRVGQPVALSRQDVDGASAFFAYPVPDA